MTCRRCSSRPVPADYRSPRRCAFQHGKFTKDNWNCETMDDLRTRAEDMKRASKTAEDDWCEAGGYDHSNYDSTIFVLAAMPPDAGHVVLSVYKHRGTVSGAWLIDDGKIVDLTLDVAERVLES